MHTPVHQALLLDRIAASGDRTGVLRPSQMLLANEESEEAADRDLPGIDGIDDGCSVVNGIYCLVGIPTSHQPNEEKASEDCCTEKNSS